jgi:hypothetical protein
MDSTQNCRLRFFELRTQINDEPTATSGFMIKKSASIFEAPKSFVERWFLYLDLLSIV